MPTKKNTDKKITRYFIPRRVEHELGTLIKDHCWIDDEGFAVYEPGWSDALCLSEIQKIDPKINTKHVITLRIALVGHMRPVPKPAPKAAPASLDEYLAELARLEKDVTTLLEGRAEDLARIEKLEAAVKANKKAAEKAEDRYEKHAKAAVGMYEKLSEAFQKRLAGYEAEVKDLRGLLATQDQVFTAELTELRQNAGLKVKSFKAALNGTTLLSSPGTYVENVHAQKGAA